MNQVLFMIFVVLLQAVDINAFLTHITKVRHQRVQRTPLMSFEYSVVDIALNKNSVLLAGVSAGSRLPTYNTVASLIQVMYRCRHIQGNRPKYGRYITDVSYCFKGWLICNR